MKSIKLFEEFNTLNNNKVDGLVDLISDKLKNYISTTSIDDAYKNNTIKYKYNDYRTKYNDYRTKYTLHTYLKAAEFDIIYLGIKMHIEFSDDRDCNTHGYEFDRFPTCSNGCINLDIMLFNINEYDKEDNNRKEIDWNSIKKDISNFFYYIFDPYNIGIYQADNFNEKENDIDNTIIDNTILMKLLYTFNQYYELDKNTKKIIYRFKNKKSQASLNLDCVKNLAKKLEISKYFDYDIVSKYQGIVNNILNSKEHQETINNSNSIGITAILIACKTNIIGFIEKILKVPNIEIGKTQIDLLSDKNKNKFMLKIFSDNYPFDLLTDENKKIIKKDFPELYNEWEVLHDIGNFNM